MNREEIIKLAREAGWPDSLVAPIIMAKLAEFATLVAAAERERIIAQNAPEIEKINAHIKALEGAVVAEREACAKVCELMEQQAEGTECCKWPTPIDCAAAIRERSTNEL